MISHPQFASWLAVGAHSGERRQREWPRSGCRLMVLMALIFGASCGAANARQASVAGLVGRIEGADVTVENPQPANPYISGAASGLASETAAGDVLDGGIVVVHSGDARLTLLSGGAVEICGPAKLTVLQASGAITLALNFGRVRAELPAATHLRIFTPTIIATPLDIAGAARDVTVGLDLNDSLCVRAASGALQLESQFSGEKLVVPQDAEFFLAGGRLVPVAGTPGSCQCSAAQTVAQARTQPAAPPMPPSAPESSAKKVVILPANPPPAAPVQTAAAPAAPIASPSISAPSPPAQTEAAESAEAASPPSVLANGNNARPIERAATNAVPAAPEVNGAPQGAVLPGLAFNTSIAAPPTRPSVNVILMAREAQVDPEWEFKGRVEPPDFAVEMQQALGEKSPAAQPSAAAAPQTARAEKSSAAPPKKKGGFWASLKRVFVGDASND